MKLAEIVDGTIVQVMQLLLDAFMYTVEFKLLGIARNCSEIRHYLLPRIIKDKEYDHF